MIRLLIFAVISIFFSCKPRTREVTPEARDSGISNNTLVMDSVIKKDSLRLPVATQEVSSGNAYADSVVSFAETLKGVPYKYASCNRDSGFDCSGFITYVFSHFGINVPRSSKDFENVGETVMLLSSRRGDLVLFTGTDTTDRTIGHMGIVTANHGGDVYFIHSTSGKKYGVTESFLGKEYLKRYVKTVRVFNQ